MEKNVKFRLNDKDIIIEITADDMLDYKREYTIQNRALNAKNIYDLLDYNLGDTYKYEEIQQEGKEKLVLEKLKELFESITGQITNIVLSLNDDEEINKRVAMIEDTFGDDL